MCSHSPITAETGELAATLSLLATENLVGMKTVLALSGPAEPVGQVGQLSDQYFRRVLLLFILLLPHPNNNIHSAHCGKPMCSMVRPKPGQLDARHRL